MHNSKHNTRNYLFLTILKYYNIVYISTVIIGLKFIEDVIFKNNLGMDIVIKKIDTFKLRDG